jgi:hypothetical protein
MTTSNITRDIGNLQKLYYTIEVSEFKSKSIQI